MRRVFLDTNILIDLLCHRQACAEAATVINKAICGEIELFCTSLTIANCVYTCRKVLGKEQTILLLQRLCNYIRIAPSGQAEVQAAFASNEPDFEDTLQYYSALSIQADVILTRNQKHYLSSQIPVMDCATYLSYY